MYLTSFGRKIAKTLFALEVAKATNIMTETETTIPPVVGTSAEAIIEAVEKARKARNRLIKTEFEKMKDRVSQQLPKNYFISLDYDAGYTPHLIRVSGPTKTKFISTLSEKDGRDPAIHEALIAAIKWAFKDLVDRKIARIWDVPGQNK